MNLVTPGLGLIFWQAFAFLAVFFLIYLLFWKSTLKSLKNRISFLEDALQKSEKAHKALEELQSNNE